MREKGSREDPGRNETILFVEDEPTLLELVKLLLEAKGYRVLTATDGLGAVEVFRQHAGEISLVLTDLGLPKLDGWQAFLKMRELKPDVAAIVATWYLDRQSADTLKDGASGFVQKPYIPGQILATVRETLDHRVKTHSPITPPPG